MMPINHSHAPTCFPTNNRQTFCLQRPAQAVLNLLELLQLHGQPSFDDFIARKPLQVVCQTHSGTAGNEPLGWIVLVPKERIAVVHRKLMVEIVVSLAHGEDSRDDVIARSQDVVVGCVSQPVRNGVDTKRTLAPNDSQQAEKSSMHHKNEHDGRP